MFQVLTSHFIFATPILIFKKGEEWISMVKWGFNVLSGGKYHKKTGQRSQALKPLHVLEDLRQLMKNVNIEVVAKSFFE